MAVRKDKKDPKEQPIRFPRKQLQDHDKSLLEEQWITQVLFERLKAGDQLSLAERKYICSKLKYFKPNDPGLPPLSAEDIDACRDSVFTDLYLTYFKNYEGWYPQRDYKADEIPSNQKKADVAVLTGNYQRWQTVLSGKPLKDPLQRSVQVETNRQLKNLKFYCKRMGYGYNRYEHLAKGTILHSRFLYLTLLEYYQESNEKEKTITICGHKILFDANAYVHILFRHYAAQVKEHQQDKSYHPGDFDHRDLPGQLFEILESYRQVVDCNKFSESYLLFKFNGTNYILWWENKPYQGRATEPVLLIKTLYPVTEKRDLNKIATLKESRISENLSIYL